VALAQQEPPLGPLDTFLGGLGMIPFGVEAKAGAKIIDPVAERMAGLAATGARNAQPFAAEIVPFFINNVPAAETIAKIVAKGESPETAAKIVAGNMKAALQSIQNAREMAGLLGEPGAGGEVIPGFGKVADIATTINRLANQVTEAIPGLVYLDKIANDIRQAAQDSDVAAQTRGFTRLEEVRRQVLDRLAERGPIPGLVKLDEIAQQIREQAAHTFDFSGPGRATLQPGGEMAEAKAAGEVPKTPILRALAPSEPAPLGTAERLAQQVREGPSVTDLPGPTGNPTIGSGAVTDLAGVGNVALKGSQAVEGAVAPSLARAVGGQSVRYAPAESTVPPIIPEARTLVDQAAHQVTNPLARAAVSHLNPNALLPPDAQQIFSTAGREATTGAQVESQVMGARVQAALGSAAKGEHAIQELMSLEETGKFRANASELAQSVAQQIVDWQARVGDRLRELGALGGDVRNTDAGVATHLTHLWTQPEKGAGPETAFQGARNLFTHERTTFPTYRAGVEGGGMAARAPTDAGAAIAADLQAQSRALALAEAGQKLKDAGYAIPLEAGAKPGAGYATFGDRAPPNLRGFQGPTDIVARMAELAQPAPKAALARFTDFIGSGPKALLFSGTPLHIGNVTFQAAGIPVPVGKRIAVVAGTLKDVLTPWQAKAWAMKNLDSIQRWGRAGETMLTGPLGDMGIIPDLGRPLPSRAVMSGLSGAAGGVAGALDAKKQGATDEDAAKLAFGGMLAGLGLGAAGRTVGNLTFQRIIPYYKLEMSNALAATGKYTDPQIADMMNRTFGGNNLAVLGRSQNMQALLRASFIAADYDEGWARNVAMGIAGIPLQGGPGAAMSKHMVGAMLGIGVVAPSLLQMATLQAADLPPYPIGPGGGNEPGREWDLETTGIAKLLGMWNEGDPRTYMVGSSPLFQYLKVVTPKEGVPYPQAVGNNAGDFLSSHEGVVAALPHQLADNQDYQGNAIVPKGEAPERAVAEQAAQFGSRYAPAPLQQFLNPRNTPQQAAAAALGVKSYSGADIHTTQESRDMQLANSHFANRDLYDGFQRGGFKIPVPPATGPGGIALTPGDQVEVEHFRLAAIRREVGETDPATLPPARLQQIVANADKEAIIAVINSLPKEEIMKREEAATGKKAGKYVPAPGLVTPWSKLQGAAPPPSRATPALAAAGSTPWSRAQ
jgi:hypothetical protein